MMDNRISYRKYSSWSLTTLAFIVILTVSLVTTLIIAQGSTSLNLAGYLDYSYGTATEGEPTGEKPESKLWWNDGFWWGSLFNSTDMKYHIYRLDWGTQNWEDTGVILDDRPDSRADVLWDGQKLYVASHAFSVISADDNLAVNWGRLYRFSYDAAVQTYSLDNGFPVNVNVDKTETLVLDKSQGKLWVTYVSRTPPSFDSQVYVNGTKTSDADWDTPLSLGSIYPEAHVSIDDISSLIAFDDKIGVMWSNQLDGKQKFYFAVHTGTDLNTGWSSLQVIENPAGVYYANDHINLAKDTSGNLFAIVKTQNPSTLVLLARDTSGTFSYHQVSEANSSDTRPIVVVNQDENKLYIFNTSKETGGLICYRTATIVTPLSNITFTLNNCRYKVTPLPSDPTVFIGDNSYDNINNATSFKQMANNTTGLVVLASDELNGQMYLHNVMGNPPPVVTHRSPDFNAVNVPTNSVISVTFSKPMNGSTINNDTFKLNDVNGPVSGSVIYDNATRTARFTPVALLNTSTEYTVTLTVGVQGADTQPLYGAPEVWNFTTDSVNSEPLPTVQLSASSYQVDENDNTATITLNLSSASPGSVTVQFSASNGTAISGADFTEVNSTVTFATGETTKNINVTILDDLLNEPGKTVNLSLSNPTGATLGTPATGTLNILDNDPMPTVQFNAASYTGIESTESVTLIVTLNTASGQTVSVDYVVTNGTAIAGADFTHTPDTILFLPGEISKPITINLVKDNFPEYREKFKVTLTTLDEASAGTIMETTVTIDDGSVQLFLPLISK